MAGINQAPLAFLPRDEILYARIHDGIVMSMTRM